MTTFFDYQKIDALQYTHATKQYVGYLSARTERFFRIGDDAQLPCPTQYCIAASLKCQARASRPEYRPAPSVAEIPANTAAPKIQPDNALAMISDSNVPTLQPSPVIMPHGCRLEFGSALGNGERFDRADSPLARPNKGS